MNKIIIYQLLPRLFGNTCNSCIPDGSIEQNGVGKFDDINEQALNAIKDLGATHVWYTGVIEHATQTDYTKFGISKDNPHIVKGKAGSPYAIKDYYDVDPDLAVNIANRMSEFESLIERTHKADLKVLIDFVPNHVARQYHSDAKPRGIEDLGANDNTDFYFHPNNNFYYIPRQLFSPSIDLGSGSEAYYEFPAKATGNDCFSAFPNQNDWYETIKLNYGIDYGDKSNHFDPIPNTWFKMLNILRFWASKGIDGFRCDMAHMVPIAFWKWAIPQVKGKYQDIIFIAEIYDVNLYRDYLYNGHFDYLYDKVNLYDTLRNIQCNNNSAARLTNCWQTIDGIGDSMLNFIENHDEQRFASRFFAGNASLVLPSLVVSSTINRGPFMIYSGQEIGEEGTDTEGFSGNDGRTTIFDYWSIATIRRWYNNGLCNNENLTFKEINLRNLYKNVLHICNSEKAITNGLFYDLMYVNYNNEDFHPHKQFAYLRVYETNILLIAVNFGEESDNIKINIPSHAFEFLKIEQGVYKATDLLSDSTATINFDCNIPFSTEIKASGAVIWKLTKERNKVSRKKTTNNNSSPNKKL